MIPILYPATEALFRTLGYGPIRDVISCFVTEERNGPYELTMVVAATTPNLENLVIGNIIMAVPYKNGTRQAFEINEITRPINQRITVRAVHISYRASFIPVAPFTSTGISATLTRLNTNAMVLNPFTLTTDFTNAETNFVLNIPQSLRACLGGTKGSVLDTFGGGGAGEYLFDNFTISFLQHRGDDNGVTLRYKKNITEFSNTKSLDNVITGCVPMWCNQEQTVVFYGQIQYAPNHTDYPVERIRVVDLSGEFSNTPSEAMLNRAGLEYVTSQTVNLPTDSITLSFIDLSDTSEAGAIAENINLCDTIHVFYEPLKVTFDAKVIKTTWNVLKERYESIEIGRPKSSFSKTTAATMADVSSLITTGKRLVSVTQTLDYELGEFNRTISDIQDIISGDGTDENPGILQNLTSVTQKADSLEEEVSKRITQGDMEHYVDNKVESTAEETVRTFTDQISSTNGQITTIRSWIRESGRGVEVGKEGNEIVGVFENSKLVFEDRSDKENPVDLAWLDSTDGLGASALSIGDAKNAGNRWRVFTAPEGNDKGAHLRFTRHST